jgi:hyperosmotically inducible periplasmic protein
MKSRNRQAFSWAAALCLVLPCVLATGCDRPGESDAVEVSRDAQGNPHVKVDGDQVEKNLEQAGQDVQTVARQAGAAVERGAERVESEVGPVVQNVLDDAGVTTRVKARLVADPEVNAFHIDVDTVDGRVTLNGKVSSELQRREAEELATRTEGVP